MRNAMKRWGSAAAALAGILVFACPARAGLVVTDLGTLGGTYSGAYGINASGQVVGFAYTAGNAAAHAFRYSGGAMSDLGTLGGTYSYARGINASGQVVGQADTAGNAAQHAFLYSGSTMTDLNSLVGSGWTITDASGINDLGQISAIGDKDGQTHALRLDPDQLAAVPEPSTLISAGTTGLMFLGLAWRRRKAKSTA